jgi:putative spermidine/putrescine transport system substrate-binding protein
VTSTRNRPYYIVILGAIVIAAVAAVLFVSACGSSSEDTSSSASPAAQEIVTATFGGALGEAEKAAYYDPWVAQGGKIKQLETEASLAAVRLQVQSGKVLWDIVELAGPDMLAGGADGTLMKLDYTAIDKSVCVPDAAQEYGLDSNHYTEGIGYLTKNFKTPPTWADFWNTTKYPGRRSMEKYIQDGTLEYAQLGAGVPKESLYPLDVDAALASLDKLGDNVVFVDSLAQASQLLIAGDVLMTQTAAGRMLALQKAGLEVGYNPVGQNGGSYFCIPTGAPHAAEAMKFLAFMASDEQGSTTMANMTGYAGPNAAGNEAATGIGAALLYTNPEVAALGFPVDLTWWTPENTEMATTKFNAWLVQH